ncbi:hypothetical protein D3C80_945530 [compost metagenome]
MMVIERDQLVETGGHLVGQLVHLAVDHGYRLFKPMLGGQGHHLVLQLEIALLQAQVTIEQGLFFGQHDQRLVLLLGFVQAGLDLFDARLVLFQRRSIAIDQQAQGQGADAQHILGHLPDRNHAGQPIAVDLRGLLAHAGHLHQGKSAQGKHQRRHQTKTQAGPGRDIHASQAHLLAPSKSAAKQCSSPCF